MKNTGYVFKPLFSEKFLLILNKNVTEEKIIKAQREKDVAQQAWDTERGKIVSGFNEIFESIYGPEFDVSIDESFENKELEIRCERPGNTARWTTFDNCRQSMAQALLPGASIYEKLSSAGSIDSVNASFEALSQIIKSAFSVKLKFDNANKNLVNLQTDGNENENIEKTKSLYESVFGDNILDNIDKSEIIKIDAHISEIWIHINKDNQTFFGFFLPYDPGFLSLILVGVLGALGASLNISKKILDGNGDEVNAWNTVLAPLYGAGVAIGIYLLVKAGLIFFASQSSASSPEPSIFLVAVIGFVSGLMADQALGAIRKTGSNWFNDLSIAPPRYGIDLNEEVKSKKLKTDDFAKLMGYKKSATFNGWFDGSEPIPIEQQFQISAWLQTDRRTLFTDVKPEQDESDRPPPDGS